jgi:Tfp pilus assembly protein PilF
MKKSLIKYSVFLLFFVIPVKSQNLSPEQIKLEKAIQFINDYKIDSAEVILKQLTKLEIEKSQPKVYVKAQLNLGRIYGDKGDNVAAFKNYYKALHTAELNNDKESIPHILKAVWCFLY